MRHLQNPFSLLWQRRMQSSMSNSCTRTYSLFASRANLLCSNTNPNVSPCPRWIRQLFPNSSFMSMDSSRLGNFPFMVSRTYSTPYVYQCEEDSKEIAEKSDNYFDYLYPNAVGSRAAKIVGPAVVCLGSTRKNSRGFGTIIDSDGTILTSATVARDYSTKESKIKVNLADGREFQGIVVNADIHSNIAIVKIESGTPLPTAKLGSFSKLRPGDDFVIAVERSDYSLKATFTVNTFRRQDSREHYGDALDFGGTYECLLSGLHFESGGPLVNLDGEVVGVNNGFYCEPYDGGLASPIESVSKILEHFKKNGKVIRPWLGLSTHDLNKNIITYLKERNATFPDVSKGVLVETVHPGSPADRAGFLPADIVIEFEGKCVGGMGEIKKLMEDKVGIPSTVVVKRATDISVTLTVVPEDLQNCSSFTQHCDDL